MLQKNGNLFPTQSRLRGKVRVRALMSDAQDQDLQRAFAASMEEQARPQSVGEDDADMMHNRTIDMEQYWAGGSPRHQRRSEDRTWSDVPVRVRPYLDSDIDAIVPSEIVLQASRNEALHVQLESYAEAVVQAWKEARAWEAERITQATRSATDAARAQFINSKSTVFQSYAAKAYDTPVPDLACPEGQPTTSITLTHTALERSVPACLWCKLAASETMDSLLITRPADVLLLNIQQQGAEDMFHIDPVLCLDPFLWSKRQGHRIDGTDECRQLQNLVSELNALEAQRKRLTEPTGFLIRPLLEQVLGYYATQDKAKHIWMQQIQDYVQQQVASLQMQQEALQTNIQDLRRHIAAQVERAAQDTSLQTVPYDLCAAIATSSTIYARRGAKHTGNRPELTALQQAIARDNERARSEVARAVGSTVH
ncbi:unnamed protein product [Malassezia sympodialis ATCC 42132]|uniref:uncharacterized protein n=1 Tax=Malassezia sympodialis (strain ATCC 42132) TaxID=1230383 RepID=UPI0002C1CBCC|nr:uncharacterized protein MSY001_0354 [Malassezia sympodialis ATCC 42132]CCU97648.1 unnamed protein product [Malassezia sympodialis ATCC 42132]|eukprot:XP_018738988.1 uncharacterized protein MSY001_0354 [Malassezia sympodialis ATCC 42132]